MNNKTITTMKQYRVFIDLLEEYGEDNDMPEGWWEEYGDIEDILIKL